VSEFSKSDIIQQYGVQSKKLANHYSYRNIWQQAWNDQRATYSNEEASIYESK